MHRDINKTKLNTKYIEEFKVLPYWHKKILHLSSQLLSVRKQFLWVSQQKYTFWFSSSTQADIASGLSSPRISPSSRGLLIWVHRLPSTNFIQAYHGKAPKEKRALMKQEEEKKVTGRYLEISSQLRGKSMVSKNSKTKNTFHLPFLKRMHFSTTQNYLTRETKVLLRETKITGSNNKNPNFFYLWHCLCSQINFIFSTRNCGKKKRAKVKKLRGLKKKKGGILGTKCTSDSVPHLAKMKQDPIGSFWTYDPPKASCQLDNSQRK